MDKKASNVTRLDDGTFVPSTRMGNTALGCNICRNSFFIIFNSITQRMHLKPPLVEPEHAPKNIHTASQNLR